jgi:hypothetical protein
MPDLNFVRKRLLQRQNHDEHGVWQIRGEDPNCDLGGSHIEPLLETVEGKFSDVVEYALTLPRFFIWGSGGSIKSLRTNGFKKVPTGISAEKILELKTELKQLEDRITEINKALN